MIKNGEGKDRMMKKGKKTDKKWRIERQVYEKRKETKWKK